ncbi:hypothetical protein PFISCL1PPCAC_6120, partial [Pristionchus fissidentatus]
LGDVSISRNHPSLPAKDALAGKYVIFYFSAHWCPPCRRFSKILKKFYDECRSIRSDIEVVFVSSDRSDSEMREYLSVQSDWFYIPFGHTSISDLSRRFGVGGIPCVVVVSPSGEVITSKGRHQIETRSSTLKLLAQWMGSDSGESSPVLPVVTPL